jgi:hypothetical protein
MQSASVSNDGIPLPFFNGGLQTGDSRSFF